MLIYEEVEIDELSHDINLLIKATGILRFRLILTSIASVVLNKEILFGASIG